MDTNINQKLGGDFHALTTLKRGKRYTLVTMSDFGIGAHAMQFTLEDIKISSYAQYSESVQLIFKLKGARKLRGVRFYGSKSFAVWKGWKDIQTETFTAPSLSHGLVVRESLYPSFDQRYLSDAIASADVPPYFQKLTRSINQ